MSSWFFKVWWAREAWINFFWCSATGWIYSVRLVCYCIRTLTRQKEKLGCFISPGEEQLPILCLSLPRHHGVQVRCSWGVSRDRTGVGRASRATLLGLLRLCRSFSEIFGALTRCKNLGNLRRNNQLPILLKQAFFRSDIKHPEKVFTCVL